MKSFVPNTLGLKIKARNGEYVNFAGVAYMGEKRVWNVSFTNKKNITCTPDHKFICPHGVMALRELVVGDSVYRADGRMTKVKSIQDTGNTEPVYDIVEAENGHVFIANAIQSHQCEFVTDDETLIDPLCLTRLKSADPAFFTNTARWYHAPEPNRTYMVALDPSMGTGGDAAAIQVFMLPEMIQIAEWQHNRTDPRNQVRILLQLLLFLDAELREHPEQSGEPEIYWTVENNSLGEAVLIVIEDTGEERFPGHFVSEKKRKGQVRRFRKGFNTDNRKKLSACARMKSLIESDRLTISSRQLITELKSFVHKEAGFSAKPGTHDDLISATLLIVRMLEVVLAWGNDVMELREFIGDDELFESEGMPVVI